MTTTVHPRPAPTPTLPSPVEAFEHLYHRARRAQAAWGEVPLAERVRRLERVAVRLGERLDSLADLIADENGKPRVEAVVHDVGAAVAAIRDVCGHAQAWLQPEHATTPWLPTREATITRRPFGVVLVIAPWNFPLSIPLSQAVDALLAGNAVVLKPSEVTPRIGRELAGLLAAADLPPDLVTVVPGDGAVGAQLIAARPDKVFFTGSVPTGRKVMAAAAAHPIPVCLELGGVDALIVLADADLELAASAAVWGAMLNHGQVCASVERLLVHESVQDRLLQRVVDKLERLDRHADLGRMTLDRQRDVYDRQLADARQRGVQVLCGGQWAGPWRLEPTVLAGPEVEQAAVWREESFGPIVAVLPFRDDDELVARHDAVPFGLTASIFSRSPDRAQRLAGRLRAGLVSINDVAATLYGLGHLPWGGSAESGFGRSHGRDGLLEFTWAQVVDRSRAGVPEIKRPWWYPYDPAQLQLMTRFVRAAAAATPGERLRHLAAMGKAAATLFAHHPRL